MNNYDGLNTDDQMALFMQDNLKGGDFEPQAFLYKGMNENEPDTLFIETKDCSVTISLHKGIHLSTSSTSSGRLCGLALNHYREFKGKRFSKYTAVIIIRAMISDLKRGERGRISCFAIYLKGLLLVLRHRSTWRIS